MAQWFQKESELEYWMQPYTGMVMMPGYKRVLHTDTRLFFELYHQLLAMGYQETQLADDVVFRRWGKGDAIPVEIAFAKTVFGLARHKNLKPSATFNCLPGRQR
jgi:hypothetical protein